MTSATSQNDPAAIEPPASTLVRAGVFGIITIAVMRAVIVFSPQLYFDVDPSISAERFGGVGMAGSLFLDAMAMLGAWTVIAGLAMQGARIRWWLVALACAGSVVVVMHAMAGVGDAADFWRGATWGAAVLCAVALTHLPAGDAMRRVAIIILLASLAPIMLRGLLQVTIEHQDTLAQFQAQKEQFFASRGWEPDSPMARIYERRLEQPNPRGWFETSNIFASLMLVALGAFGGLLIATLRLRLSSGWVGLLGIILAAACGGIWFSGSRGAMLIGLMCAGLLLVPAVWRQGAAIVLRSAGVLAIIGCAFAMAGVAVRGAVLPESFAGELSILFRWHYWQGAWRALMDNMLLGVGPGGFQDAYSLHRPERSPEEVVSAHNVFVDWFACLGIVAGAGWTAVLVAMMWRLRAAPRDDHAQRHPWPVDQTLALASVGTIATIVCVMSLIAERPGLDGVLAMMRIAGFAAMVVLGWVIASLLLATDAAADSNDAQHASAASTAWLWGLRIAAIGLLIHSQIEMTLFQSGSVLWYLCFLGAVVPMGNPVRAGQSSMLPVITAVAVGCIMVACIIMVAAVPAWSQQRMVADAAAMIARASPERDMQLATRQRAAATLIDAYERWPANAQPLVDAVDQLRQAASLAELTQRRVILDDACELARRGVEQHPTQLRTAAALSLATYQRAAAEQTPENWQDAVDAAARLTEMDPHAIASWRRLGDVLWGAQRQAEAADAYRRALQNNSNFELDPLKQLSEADRALIEQRIDE